MRLGDAPLFGCIEIPVDAVSDAGGGGPDGVAGEVGVAGGRLDLCVPQELSDHRQALAKRQSARSERMAEVMDPYIVEPGALPDAPPRVLEIGEVRARLAACYHPGIVLVAG